MTRLTENERTVLTAWKGTCVENNVLPFSVVSDRCGVVGVRRYVRSLSRKGVLELTTGFSDEGTIMGKGYMPTVLGQTMIDAL